MPAKRNPKKSRKQSVPQVIPPKLDALTVAPPTVALPTEPLSPTVSLEAVPSTATASAVPPTATASAVPSTATASTVPPAIGAGVSAVAAGSVALPEAPVVPGASATPPRSGPPAGRQARFSGRSQRAGQTRFYAFRRS
ncbi:hypothetical protein NMK34_23585 [Micromonospora sp. BRA006-A]|uniref:hypothetical protein n=1 Tax=Micromonospora sp. BRA006-A TaxID=2962860 RepID=UPI00296F21E2|nr:hypothetical protein [Micromonospora sp. BRA006-A]MDW3849599.1 hypothetical protein [Micromonospora sp. BRA006-A]